MCQRQEGILIRDDGKPLRTKFVATLGTPELYDGNGAVGIDNRPLSDTSYRAIISEFYEQGVDVVRLNCAHDKPKDLGERFNAIKEAILWCEEHTGRCKRMAVLADLPGPKVRFEIEAEFPVALGNEFVVHFEQIAKELGRCTEQGKAFRLAPGPWWCFRGPATCHRYDEERPRRRPGRRDQASA